MLSYKEYDNAQAVEIVLKGRVSTEEFDSVASKLEAFIQRHGQVRVLEIIKDFEGMDAVAFWHDIKFSLRHLNDFSRMAVVCNPDTLAEAVQGVLGEQPSAPEEMTEARQAPTSGARESLLKADQALRKGDWTAFGREWERLKSLLEK